MGYSRNFGMRSFENIVRDGRHRVPKTGSPLKIGSAVQVDTATPGFLKVPDAAAPPTPLCGLVVFEHIQFKGVDTGLVGSVDEPFNLVPLGQYAQMVHGVGTKVWFKNTAAKVLYDGRSQNAGALLAAGTYNVGDGLGPVADGLLGAAAADVAWLIVEQSNPSTGLVEARFTF